MANLSKILLDFRVKKSKGIVRKALYAVLDLHHYEIIGKICSLL